MRAFFSPFPERPIAPHAGEATLGRRGFIALKIPKLLASEMKSPYSFPQCALSSVEEHFLHTEGVAGSSPAARTISWCNTPLLFSHVEYVRAKLTIARAGHYSAGRRE